MANAPKITLVIIATNMNFRFGKNIYLLAFGRTKKLFAFLIKVDTMVLAQKARSPIPRRYSGGPPTVQGNTI